MKGIEQMNIFKKEYLKLESYINKCKKANCIKECNECNKFNSCIPVELMESIEYTISKAMKYSSEYND